MTVIEAPARARVLAIRSGTSISTPPLVRVRVGVGHGAGVRAGVKVGVRVGAMVRVWVRFTLVVGGYMARPCMRTKVSSTPMPRSTKGST